MAGQTATGASGAACGTLAAVARGSSFMYDPTIGRWLSEDPIGFEAGDANLYRYVENGPVKATDPSGTIKQENNDTGFEFWNLGTYPVIRQVINYYTGNDNANDKSKELEAVRQSLNKEKKLTAGDILTRSGKPASVALQKARSQVKQLGRDTFFDLAEESAIFGFGRFVSKAETIAKLKIRNIEKNHLKPRDYIGTLRDMIGNPVPKPGGGFWDHVSEMNNTLRGLRKHAKTLEGTKDPAGIAARERALELIKKMEEFMEGAGL